MTLSHRLSTFFLVILGIVLVLLCLGVPIATHVYLHRQTRLALNSALNTITAAMEVEPEVLEWEPDERNLIVEPGPLGQPIVWLLVDPRGQRVDDSADDAGRKMLLAAASAYPLDARQAEPLLNQHDHWLLIHHWVTAARPRAEIDSYPNHKFAALGVSAAIDVAPVGTLVRAVAIGLTATSALLWLSALLIGRRIGRHILQPITRLAHLAARMDATQLGERLVPAKTGDELEALTFSFNGLLDRLQESFERQRRFTGDAAHQLRTPLTAMRGHLEIALRRPRSADEYQTVLEKLHGQVLHLHDMVESLLFLARADDEALLRQLQSLELRAWLTDQLAIWRQQNAEVELLVTMCDAPCWIQAQSVLLGELVNIVLDNAFKYREPGTAIAIELRQSNHAATIVVANQAPAFSANELADLFEPFHRSEHARRRGIDGLGLGLAIARRLADTFSGQITASSDDGHIRFAIELPLAPAMAAGSYTLASSTP